MGESRTRQIQKPACNGRATAVMRQQINYVVPKQACGKLRWIIVL
jgi:hypothetical protein